MVKLPHEFQAFSSLAWRHQPTTEFGGFEAKAWSSSQSYGLVPLNPSIVLDKAPDVQIVAERHQPRMDPVLKGLGPGELKKISIMLRVDDQVASLGFRV